MSFVSYNAPKAKISIHLPPDLFKSDALAAKMPEVVMDSAKEARDFWETTAGQRLNTSRQRYQDAIAMEQRGDDVHLHLKGVYAIGIELGDEFDMRPQFRNSPKMKPAPIRKKIPRAIAQALEVSSLSTPAYTKWMVIPMGKPSASQGFVTFTDNPRSLWRWNKKKTHKGVQISVDVAEELANVILPKHLEKAIDEVFGR